VGKTYELDHSKCLQDITDSMTAQLAGWLHLFVFDWHQTHTLAAGTGTRLIVGGDEQNRFWTAKYMKLWTTPG